MTKLLCDRCNKLIVNIEGGMVFWGPPTNKMVVAHKGTCDNPRAYYSLELTWLECEPLLHIHRMADEVTHEELKRLIEAAFILRAENGEELKHLGPNFEAGVVVA